MIFARNEIVIPASYLESGTFKPGEGKYIDKLTVQVFDNDVILQASEVFPVTFTDSTETEMKLVKGFHSRVPIAPWTGFRFRSLGASSRVTFVAYA